MPQKPAQWPLLEPLCVNEKALALLARAGRESLADAIRHSEFGGEEGGPAFEWDLALDPPTIPMRTGSVWAASCCAANPTPRPPRKRLRSTVDMLFPTFVS